MSLFFNWSPDAYEYIPTSLGYALMTAVLIIAFLLILAVHKNNSKKMSAKELAFCAMAMALAVIASFIKLTSLPFGGSVTLFSMFFICLVGYVYGANVGILAGIAYGFLQLVIQPYIYHPIQVLLDYPLAFGALGLSGIFAKKQNGLVKGYLLGVLGRYIMHVISGYVFFASYAPEGMNPMIYTLGYNLTYILPEAVATTAILFVPAVANGIRIVRNTVYSDQENDAGLKTVIR